MWEAVPKWESHPGMCGDGRLRPSSDPERKRRGAPREACHSEPTTIRAKLRPHEARLLVFQASRNPTARDREILTLLAEGHTHKQAAGHLGLAHRSVTNALGRMRARYTTPTNEALIALAVRLQWINVAIECTDPKDTGAQNH